jgi:hypothetical protein
MTHRREQPGSDRSGRVRPCRWVLGQQLGGNPIQLRWHTWPSRRRRAGIILHLPVGQTNRRVGGERGRVGWHLEHHATEGVQAGLADLQPDICLRGTDRGKDQNRRISDQHEAGRARCRRDHLTAENGRLDRLQPTMVIVVPLACAEGGSEGG